MRRAEETPVGPVGQQPAVMPRCFAAVETCTHHSAADPSVRNAGGHESKALQVVSPRPLFELRIPQRPLIALTRGRG